jgi:hypothetical protein
MSFRTVAAATTMMMPIAMGLPVVAANAVQAPVGEGFTITPSDLSYILKQIKIAERHAATLSPEHPCDTLIGTGPDQIPSPLVSAGLRTVDGSCNNLQPGQETFGSADQKFPRLTTPSFKSAEDASLFGGPAASSYAQKSGTVVDSEPRVISNLIVDQTSKNPAAVAAAGNPVRTQGNEGVVPCTTDPDPLATPEVVGVPAGCVPSNSTLFIENVTTDVGLSPPYNSMFTLFGQFFDHGVDQTVKSGGTVFVPLKADDPLRTVGPDGKANTGDEVPASQAFMVLTRGQNQPGADGVLGTADDEQDANNTDSPWVDQSQTYTSHSSHQVFVREYVDNADGKPVATGKLLGGTAGTKAANGMATWDTTKKQARTLLGLRLEDKDVLNVPMIAADPYGKFIPGPNGLPQYVTATGLVEGQLDDPSTPTVDETVPVPANVKYFDTPFLTDIAHNADPSPQDTDHNPATAKVVPTPDTDNTASADFASQAPGTYDDEMLNAHFIAGDGRVNENIGLTAIHQIFHSEHDRLVDDIENVLTTDTSASGVKALAEWKLAAGADGWNGERLFQAARFITEMEYQHLVFEEFARKVQPAINPFEPFAFTQTELNPAVKAEFAHAVYRFGHSMLTETISRRNEDGAGPDTVYGTSDDTRGSQNDISLLDGFLNPPEYTNGGPAGPLTSEEAAGSIIMGMADQAGNELDEFVTDTLRNNLLGLPLDLPTINMTRARSEGIPRLNVLRREIFNKTNDGQLKPYISWVDFGENLKHPESLVNFVAAYGQHPSITGATTLAGKREAARLIVSPAAGDVPPADAAAFMNSTDAWSNDGSNSRTGLDNVDLWVGGLAETTVVFGGLLGSTFNYVFENQLTDLQNGDRLYYLARTPGMNLRAQLEGNSFAEMMMRNTNVHSLKADVFATSDCKFELKKLGGTPAGFAADGNTVADDLDSECSEPDLLIRMPDGTIKYRARNTVDPSGINGQSVYNGTAGVDRIFGGNDSDTFWGGEGNDVIEGGDGADVALGGDGDDIITDLAGDDVPKGGPGNDAIDAGPGLDIVMGGDGKDFTNGGANANETFAGAGDDFVMLGQSLDAAFGDSGDDWEEGGDQPDLMQGDSGNLFFLDDSQKPGHDILIGQGGDDDYDMEGGDDIGLGGPGIEKVAGASGYDWEIGLGDPQPQNLDLDLPLVPLDILTADVRDKFNEVEAASGWKFDDKIRGDDVVPSGVGGGGFIGCNVLDPDGVGRIAGLGDLVTAFPTLTSDVVAASASKDCPVLTGTNVWGEGNILLGGGGSDLLEGRGANDIIDGDRYLSVRLSVRNPDDHAVEIGSAAADGPGQSAMTSRYTKDANGNLTGPTLQEAVFAGTVNPGDIEAVREILTASGGTDSAVFSGPEINYTVTTVDANGASATLGAPGSTTTVTDNTGTDGTDTLRNIERLVFSDTVAPAAPVVGAVTTGNGQATVNFTPAAGGVATSFQVRVVDGSGAQVGALRTADTGATSLVVTGLANGTPVRFQVRALNAIGTSDFSAMSGMVTPAAPVFAGAPTIGSPTAGNAQATVRWTAPAAVANAAAVTQYRVRVFVGTAATPTREVTVGNVTNTAVTGLINSTGYTFDVSAINSAGTGAPSARSALTTPRTEFVAPTITARTPAASAGSVSQTNNLTATFSEAVTNVTTSSVVLRLGTTSVPAAVTYNNATRTVTVNPTANLLADRTYTVSVSGAAAAVSVRDTAGNTMANTSWQFTTGPAPTVIALSPGGGATNVSRTANVTARFSEGVTGLNGTTVRLIRQSNGAATTAVVSYNAATRTVTLNPSATLLANTQYRISLTGGTSAIRDLAGNPLGSGAWIFRTGTR